MDDNTYDSWLPEQADMANVGEHKERDRIERRWFGHQIHRLIHIWIDL